MRISRQPSPSPVTIMIDQKQLKNVECFKYLGSMLTNDGRCTCEIKSRIAMAKAAFNKKKTLFISTLDLNLRKKLVKCYIWSMALYGAETWTLWAADQKYLGSFEMWCWRRMEKISWTDHVRNEEVLLRVNEQRNILHEIRKWKDKGPATQNADFCSGLWTVRCGRLSNCITYDCIIPVKQNADCCSGPV